MSGRTGCTRRRRPGKHFYAKFSFGLLFATRFGRTLFRALTVGQVIERFKIRRRDSRGKRRRGHRRNKQSSRKRRVRMTSTVAFRRKERMGRYH